MIKSLTINNFAIIKDLNIPFKKGLTVITGETGSGKTLILDALRASLGFKADKIMVRNGEEKAIINTNFNNLNFERIILKNGKTKSFFNGELITLNSLKNHKLVKIEFHGQNDQQIILDPVKHIDFLDEYCGHENKVDFLKNIFKELQHLNDSLINIVKSTTELKEKLELLNFQANEIDSLNILENEDIDLHEKYKKLTHLKEIIETLQDSNYAISEKNESILPQVENLKNRIESIEKYDKSINIILTLIDQSIINIQEAQNEINDQLSNLDFDAQEVQIIEERLTAIETLKRKYGGSLECISIKRAEIQIGLKDFKNPEKQKEKIRNKIFELEKKFSQIAIELHRARKKIGSELSIKIANIMKNLNMQNAQFEIKITNYIKNDNFVNYDGNKYSHNNKGIDNVEFYFTTNPGEPLKPLSLIASGGEISRVMLAIKTVFENIDPAETLVFDEIDSGISGKSASKVASHLLQLSKNKQVICISHLPQIALKADHHLHIEKYIQNKNTYVNYKYTNDDDRMKIIKELFQAD